MALPKSAIARPTTKIQPLARNHDHTIPAGPAGSEKARVLAMDGRRPMMEKAIPKTSSVEKFRFNSCLYPILANSSASASLARTTPSSPVVTSSAWCCGVSAGAPSEEEILSDMFASGSARFAAQARCLPGLAGSNDEVDCFSTRNKRNKIWHKSLDRCENGQQIQRDGTGSSIICPSVTS